MTEDKKVEVEETKAVVVKSLEELGEPQVVEGEKRMRIFSFDLTDLKGALTKYKDFKIVDGETYKTAKNAIKVIRKLEINLEKIGKAARDPQTVHNKQIKSDQDELTGTAKEVRDDLFAQVLEKDQEKVKEYGLKVMPERKKLLEGIGMKEIKEDEIVLMDDTAFDIFLNEEKIAIFDAKKVIEDAEKERQASEKRDGRLARIIGLGFVKVGPDYVYGDLKVEGSKLELEDAEFEELFSGLMIDADKVKQSIIKSNKDAKDLKDQRDKEAKEAREKADAGYQKFLADNGYNETNKELFIIEETADSYRLFSKSLLAEHRK